MKAEISVSKCDPQGREFFRYPVAVLERGEGQIVVEGRFRPEPVQVGGLWLAPGDRFVETYFEDLWYNIYAVYDRENDTLKGWYCNISYPPEIGQDLICYRDLALDLVVTPNGAQEVLDEDEFEALGLSPADRAAALNALRNLQEHFRQQFEN